MGYRRKNIPIKTESEYRLIRLANRNTNRAKRDLAEYKRTGNVADKRAYEMHRKRSFRYRKELAKRTEQLKAVSIKELPKLRKRFPRPKRKREKEPTTVYQRTVKYREDGQTKKAVMKIGFVDKESVEGFVDLVQKGQIPIPIGLLESDIFMFDIDSEDYVLRRLIALFGGS